MQNNVQNIKICAKSNIRNKLLKESNIFLMKERIEDCEGRPLTERTNVQGGSNMTGTDLCVNKPHCAAAVRP